MARYIKEKMAGADQFNSTIYAVPDSNYDIAFDSYFEKSSDPAKNCVLRLNLRIFYRQINPYQLTEPVMRVLATAMGINVPAGAKVGSYPDGDDNPQFIKDWNAPEWSQFLTSVKTQAMLWDSRFWLMPPDNFPYFDIVQGSGPTARKTRPNVKCEFTFQLGISPAYSHSTIEVVNMLNPTAFRSHSRLYSSEDVNTDFYSKPDANNVYISTHQPTIAHEVGHALGLPHIGVSRDLAHCKLAVMFDKKLPQEYVPALYKGGTNADVCYGTRGAAGDIDNIMGFGDKFDKENAKPWLDRLPQHLNLSMMEYGLVLTNLPKWQVSTTAVPPMSLIGF